jgi:hypothetical protein
MGETFKTQEVRRMKEGGFWTVFRDTGDPICYVIGKKIEQNGDGRSAAGDGKTGSAACAAGPRGPS